MPRPGVVLAVLLVPLVLLVGIWLGGHPDRLPGFVRSSALVEESQHARVVDEAFDIIERDYYREVDRADLVNDSLKAGVEALHEDDPFSTYFDPTTYEHFQEAASGEFEGVGMTVEAVSRGLRVVQAFDGSPADRAGIESGDVIVGADGEDLAGMTTTEATALIKGPAGTHVELRVRSDGDTRRIRVRRERVDVPVVESEMRRADGEEVGHVSLASFTSGAHGEVRDAVGELLDEGADSMVLDLRDNGGGLLNEAVLVSSVFIPEGPVVRTNGRSRPERVFEATGSAIATDVPVSVLVNENSASAAEIVAGALQDRDRGRVIGCTRTFGKGVFQEVVELSNGGALDITVGEYFTPDGRNLAGNGIRPDVRACDDEDTARDEVLDAALEAAAGGSR